MYAKQELQDLIKQEHQRTEDTMVAAKRRPASLRRRPCSQGVVVRTLRKIGKIFEAEGCRVWIHLEANRAWLTITDGTACSDEREPATQLKYQVEVSRQTMKSRLYQMTGGRAQEEHPIGDEREIAGSTNARKIADVTSQDIIEDFIAAYEEDQDRVRPALHGTSEN